jgi:hypothetical protein
MQGAPALVLAQPPRSKFARPAFVLGPVDIPPWNRQRRFPGSDYSYSLPEDRRTGRACSGGRQRVRSRRLHGQRYLRGNTEPRQGIPPGLSHPNTGQPAKSRICLIVHAIDR